MSHRKTQRLKAYRFRLDLSEDQRDLCGRFSGHCRFVWNLFRSQRETWYKAVSEIPPHERDKAIAPNSYESQANQLPALKKQYPWLAEAPSHCLQQTLRDLHMAYGNFFARRGGYPKFKRKDRGRDSFRFPDPKHIERRNNTLKLPKLGWVKIRNSYSRIRGDIRSVTVSRRGRHWYASVLYHQEVLVPYHPSISAIGLDRNCGDNLCALSTGEVVEGLTPFREALKRLARLQRSLSRKKKGSANFNKARAKVSHLHERIANIRQDLLHKLSHRLSKSHAAVVVEDLQVKAMTASAKGTVECPGSRTKQKSGLNRSILDRGWGELERQLHYKLAWRGGELLKVPAAYTSQTCHACGHTLKENRSKSRFACVCCGHEDHADINAAKNILKAAGLVASACGGFGISRPVKQERENAVRLPTGGLPAGV